MRMRVKLGVIVTLGLALVCLGANAAPVGDVLARPASEVSGSDVRLGDIAAIRCTDKALAEILKGAYICAAPLPGKTTRLSRAQIAVALQRNGLKGSANLLAPAELTVTRASGRVTGQAIFEAARDFILAGSWQGDVVVEPVIIPRDQATPSGKLEMLVSSRAQKIKKGRNTLPVDVVIDGTRYCTVPVSVMIRLFAPVLVASQTLSNADEVNATNTRLERIEITNLPEDLVKEPISTRVMATYPIAEGAAIRTSWVSKPPVIRAGDNVVVAAVGRFVRVTDTGTAVNGGGAGDVIKVRLNGSSREVRGTAVEPGLVEIQIDGGSNNGSQAAQ